MILENNADYYHWFTQEYLIGILHNVIKVFRFILFYTLVNIKERGYQSTQLY